MRRVFHVAVLIIMLATLAQVSVADSTWTVFTASDSPLPTDFVSSLYFDNAGNHYIGTHLGGLVLRQDSLWTIWDESSTGVPIDLARLVERDSFGNLWVGAASGNLDVSPYGFGVARLSAADSSWEMFTSGLEVSLIVTGIIIDSDVRYVSTYGGGITVYDTLGWIRYRHTSRTEFTYADSQQQTFEVDPGTYIPSDFIRAMDIDRSTGAIWLATVDGGAVEHSGESWTTFTSGNSGLPSNQLLAIKVDPHNGDVYFGTAGFGVARLSDTLWTVYDPNNSPMTNGFVHTIEVRPHDGEVWFGTGHGVWVLQTDGNWRGYIPPDNNFIWGEFYSDIAFDSSGAAWVSAYGGGMAFLVFEAPPPDTFEIDVIRLKVKVRRNRPQGIVMARLDAFNPPELAPEDTVAMILESESGELYSFHLLFGDFQIRDRDGRIEYRFRGHHFDVRLIVRADRPDVMEVRVRDTEADLNLDNFDTTLTLTLRLGEVSASEDVTLRHRHNEYAYDSDDETEPDEDEEATGIDDNPQPLAATLKLKAFPNPFNGKTSVSFNLETPADVRLEVYDLLGRLVERIYAGPLPAGSHRFAWPQREVASATLTSGVYFYRLVVGQQSLTGKMLYLR